MAANIELIKKLREEMGGIGMSDCKKALEETSNNYEEAITWLRKKGIATAAKKASRVAAEGLIGVFSNGSTACATEVNSETDFVAENAMFQKLVSDIAKLAIDLNGDVEALSNAKIDGETVSNAIVLATASIGEKISLRRTASVSVSNGVVATYIHNAVQGKPDLGKIAILLGIETSSSSPRIMEVGKQICMHIASMTPKFLTTGEVSKDELEKERAIFTEQASASGKPAQVIEKMVEGRLSKFYSEVVLLEQPFVMEPKITVKQLLENLKKELNAEIELKQFVSMKVGEGIEKQSSDFAAEVAELAK